MSFTRKIIQVALKLGKGTFTGTNADTLTIRGLRVRFHMTEKYGYKGDVVCEIFGLTDSQMKQLSTYGSFEQLRNPNQITISAGDDETGLTTIFNGNILSADARYSQPEASLVVSAMMAGFIAVAKAPPVSYKGGAAVSVIMNNLAEQAGLRFENSGVSSSLVNPYFSGSLGDQIKSCARAAGINHVIDTTRNVLAIWPRNGSRGGAVPLVSPQTGMVGYPDFALQQIMFRTELNSIIEIGRKVEVRSSIPNATGKWTVTQIETNLETEEPRGMWFQEVTAFSNLPDAY